MIEHVVRQRAVHETAEHVQVTCSFARAEQLLGREYHGRFLIELLQNAADAWRQQAQPGQRGPVRIVLEADGRALAVANRGAAFPAQVVLTSLGHVGRSTKDKGEAIGHKGIGFKSVLEVSSTPELYSALRPGGPGLAVRFDAVAALAEIRAHSPGWEQHLADVDDMQREIDAVPVLRFPRWVEQPPPVVAELAAEGFTTIVRLPFSSDGLADEWLAVVRRALEEDVTDQVLLLLGTFDEVVIDDRLAGTRRTVAPSWRARTELPGGVSREEVVIKRDGEVSSSWFLYRQGEGGLAGETAAGVRVQATGDGPPEVVPPLTGDPGSPFHLFFPTRIASGMPLLLHGYFEVDAARTGFYDGEGSCNAAVLDALAGLCVRAVDDLAGSGAVDLVSLVERLAGTTPPDDPQARRTREAVMAELDAVAWVPLSPGGDEPRRARPVDCLLTWDDRLDDALLRTFPVSYLERCSGRRVPHRDLSAAARALLRLRHPADEEQGWADLGRLLRPGPVPPWPAGDEDTGFRDLLSVVNLLQALDRGRADALLASLRGDPLAQLLPVPQLGGGRRLYPLPAPEEGVRGRRSALVMGRVRTGGVPLQPPEAMDVVFLRDGLLESEADGDRAKPLGVRPFTVDTVLDRLSAVQSAQGGELVTFLWTLLARARGHDAGTATGSRLAAVLDPAQWFWCQPGRGDLADSDRIKQRRQRQLAEVRLQARDGSWQPAGTLALGADWAAWLKGWAPDDHATAARVAAYRALDRVAPEDSALLGPPEQVLALLPVLTGLQDDDAVDGGAVELDQPALERERLAFLLRLGVWEVLPVQAYDDREADAERPWADLRERVRPGVDAGPWSFEGAPSDRGHLNVRVSEDFRFRWPLEQPDVERRRDVATLLSAGTRLYSRLAEALAFCRACSDNSRWHRRPYRTGVEDRGVSTLALQLAESPWVPSELAAVPQPAGSPPGAVWWAENPPAEQGMANSPLRFLPLLHRDAGVSAELRRLCGIIDLEHSPLERLADLLRGLREGVVSGALPGPGGGRQALVGLHRLVYGRLRDLRPEAVDLLLEVGVLCELDGTLVMRPPAESRHDDDRFSTYRRHFTRVVPFVVLARDKAAVAEALALPSFVVAVRREGDDAGVDVTAELSDALADRLPELFAVLVHHSLGAQTLEPTSTQFDTRSSRLRALVVRQVQDLVLQVEVSGTGHAKRLGQGEVQDLFLDTSVPSRPVLYHDLSGPGWQRRLRTRLAGHLAALADNTAYTATFQLLLLAEDDAERERVLHDLGISDDEVQEVRRRLGAVTELDRRAERAWRRALLLLPGAPAEPGPDLASDLLAAGLPADVAEQAAAAGGGQAARSGSGPVLRLLHGAGVDLPALDRALREDGDPGLDVRAAAELLRGWKNQHERWLVAVLATAGTPEDTARAGVAALSPPRALALVLDPEPAQVLAGVVDLLRTAGLAPEPAALAADPRAELVRLARVSGPDELDERVEALYVDDERRRVFERMSSAWRRELAFLGTLARATPGEARAVTRAHHEAVLHVVPSAGQPSALRACLPDLLPELSGAQELLEAQLVDSVTAAPPDRGALLEELAGWLPVPLAGAVQAAVAQPVKELVRQVRERVGRLADAGVAPVAPAGLVTPGERPARPTGPRTVARVTVDVSVDRRKKQLGDEGEAWAFAGVVRPLLDLSPAARAQALDEVVGLLCRYAKGPAVDAALAHLAAAASPDTDEEDLVADLAGLLHVSRHGDGFGYDLLGWLPPAAGAPPQAVALEVKSSGEGGFLLSRNEWATAERFAAGAEGDAYAVLVVRRGTGGVPARMDLLRDPVRLVATHRLSKEEDTYRVRYALG